ncbi:DUF309 domain-containing protein [Streptomyces sp. NBC_01216]|uniref:DUF309 domain-containing protein n=1 Tax=unclassified Streptomyces TaxID=2593676 RepID=UPI002E13358D|nr:DUF309 domain-containing protein [Streptomyces sp. NBC_01216]
MGPRDRDEAGRARSARPRDALGRPLPYGAEGVARQPEGVARTPAGTLGEAQRLLDAGRPFHAHEVFEDAWKTGPAGERDLWQGLAQLAVGLTHVARGNARGGARLLSRGADRIGQQEPRRQAAQYGIDVAGLVAWARELADHPDRVKDASAEAPRLLLGGGPSRRPGAAGRPPEM